MEVHGGKVRQDHLRSASRLEQLGLQLMLGEWFDGSPRQARRQGCCDIFGAHTLGDTQHLGVTPLGLSLEQDVLQDRIDHLRSQKGGGMWAPKSTLRYRRVDDNALLSNPTGTH